MQAGLQRAISQELRFGGSGVEHPGRLTTPSVLVHKTVRSSRSSLPERHSANRARIHDSCLDLDTRVCHHTRFCHKNPSFGLCRTLAGSTIAKDRLQHAAFTQQPCLAVAAALLNVPSVTGRYRFPKPSWWQLIEKRIRSKGSVGCFLFYRAEALQTSHNAK